MDLVLLLGTEVKVAGPMNSPLMTKRAGCGLAALPGHPNPKSSINPNCSYPSSHLIFSPYHLSKSNILCMLFPVHCRLMLEC